MQSRSAALFVSTGLLVLAVTPAQVAAAGNEVPKTPGACSVVYHEEVVIAASPSTIWNVLIDLPSYGAWNPWLIHAEGDMVPGGAVTVEVILNGNAQKAEHTVITVEPYTRFCWKDAGWTAWLAPAQRCRTFEPRPDGTVKFVNELMIDGVLAKLVDLTNGASLRAGMAAESAALKQRAESL